MTNRIWQNFLASNIHRGINKVAAQKSSSNKIIRSSKWAKMMLRQPKYEGYTRTPDSSEGLIPGAIICYKGIDP